jgi:hypothetical protein
MLAGWSVAAQDTPSAPDATTSPTPVAAAVSACDEASWPDVPVTCAEAAASVSLGMTVTGVRIWLTTIGAIDVTWAPGRQVGNHPMDPLTPVWLFVYDGYRSPITHADESGALVTSAPETRLLRVVDATDPLTRDGAFVYLYGWSELGSPLLPETMPMPALERNQGGSLAAGAASTCRVSQPARDLSPELAPSIGTGPVFAVAGDAGRMRSAADGQGGWSPVKVLWVAEARYSGRSVIRGTSPTGKPPEVARLAGRSGGPELVIDWGAVRTSPRSGWKEVPSGWTVPQPGCFGWEVDVPEGRRSITYEVIADGTPPSPEMPG